LASWLIPAAKWKEEQQQLAKQEAKKELEPNLERLAHRPLGHSIVQDANYHQAKYFLAEAAHDAVAPWLSEVRAQNCECVELLGRLFVT